MIADSRLRNTRPLAVYIHWPFCKALCPYCDFNSHVQADIPHARWAAAYACELEHWAAQTTDYHITSVFFGGGTPSLMAPETVQHILKIIQTNWVCNANMEITLEANPTSIEAAKLQAFKEAGINRVSIGVQSLDDEALKFLGRQHSASEALGALALARQIFANVSFDLIYARAGQTVSNWQAELTAALALQPDHLSLYQLTIEAGTPFYTQAQRGVQLTCDDETSAELYEYTQGMTAAAGYASYEISNYAKPGYASQHNLAYWRYQDYLGIGPGAHGRVTLNCVTQATLTHRAPSIWLEQVEAQGHALKPFILLSVDEVAQEILLMGLRLAEGVPLQRLQDRTGHCWEYWVNAANWQTALQQNWVWQNNTRIGATAAGRQRLQSLLGFLIAE